MARAELSRFAAEVARRVLSARRVPAGDIDDLAQETVLAVLGHLDADGEQPREIAGFVKWRALGILSDQRRSARNRTMQSHQAFLSDPVSPARGPAAAARDAEVRAALADCRARLGADARDLLALRYEGGCDAQALATRLGVTRNAIHVRTFRALAALRECLERKGIDPEDVP
jgi:RNA polymerase sigma factor (sigma-70 family)